MEKRAVICPPVFVRSTGRARILVAFVSILLFLSSVFPHFFFSRAASFFWAKSSGTSSTCTTPTSRMKLGTYTDLDLKHEPQIVDSRRMGHGDPELRLCALALDSVVHVKPETRTRPGAVSSFEVVLATASRSNDGCHVKHIHHRRALQCRLRLPICLGFDKIEIFFFFGKK
ncbi:hypothetical protein HDV63DRAFT_290502 [Trichoderma sp. SZMC 28014]